MNKEGIPGFCNYVKHSLLLSEWVKIISFSLLSIIFSKFQFLIPSAVAGISDMREIALILSIFYCRKWHSFIFISLISSLSLPPEGSFMVNWMMHAIGLIGAFLSYRCLIDYTTKQLVLLGYWVSTCLSYFYILLLPSMEIGHALIGKIQYADIISKYLEIAPEVFFEALLTTAVSALFLLYLSTTQLLEKHIGELESARAKAEESEKLKTAFLQNLSHEIRTPLNGIMGFSRLLDVKIENNSPLKEYTKVITRSGDQLLNIVHDIIDASQIETDQLDFCYSKNTVSKFTEEISLLLPEKQDRLQFNLTNKNPPTIKTDYYKLIRIVYHLTHNALKFSDKKLVVISLDLTDTEIFISVKDKGIGIAEDKHAQIFENFRQLEGNLTRLKGGNGVGLSIANGFTKALNGKIWVESYPDKGSTFYVKIPFEDIA